MAGRFDLKFSTVLVYFVLFLTILLYLEFNLLIIMRIIIFFVIFRFYNQHLSVLLIQLEVLALLVISILGVKSFFKGLSLVILLRIMVITVIEACIGLSLIVKQSRYTSVELIKFL